MTDYKDDSIWLMKGNCLERMKEIQDGSVDLTVTSPPYDNLRSYNGNNALWGECAWKSVIKDLYRVTADGGIVVWVVGDATIKGSETGTSFKQALWAMECGFRLHDTMIYHKGNTPPLNHPRYEQAFEYMFIFSKGKPKAVNLIKVPCKHAGKRNTGTMRNNGSDDLSKKHGHGKNCKDDKPRTNIWTYFVGGVSKSAKIAHPAKFPDGLAKDHIISWSNEGDTVLDPFMGSGTTGADCKNLNRNFIGIEMDDHYFEVAKGRILGDK